MVSCCILFESWLVCACSIQQGSAHAGRVLLECSLVSLQAMEQAVGEDSAQYKAATKITMKLVQIVQQLVSDAYDNRCKSHAANSAILQQCCMCALIIHH